MEKLDKLQKAKRRHEVLWALRIKIMAMEAKLRAMESARLAEIMGRVA
ncbi:MAG: hypothetical protein HGA87_02490 [Desulfobulbaceae bacterium]|nr:hypothetical protein [Desulfobulbaceae bacterium]